jgi:hypothetical protein
LLGPRKPAVCFAEAAACCSLLSAGSTEGMSGIDARAVDPDPRAVSSVDSDCHAVSAVDSGQSTTWLLQLPAPALHLVLQQLDQRSLACTAVTCSTLSRAVPAAISKVYISTGNPDTIASYKEWLQTHSTARSNLQECFVL